MMLHSIPMSATSFVGRNEELARIATLLTDPTCRLLTLLGPGGIGKTRLAIQASNQSDFTEGAYLIHLTPLSSPDLLPSAIASALQITFYDASDLRRQLADSLGNKHLLLVMDNFEHLLDGVELLKKARALDPDAAFLVLTGVANVQTAVESLKFGAFDFIMKPVHMDEILIAAERALQHRQLLIERREHQAILERKVEEATRELGSTLRELENTYRTTLEALGSAIDTRDLGTHAHSRRVRGYSLALARAHGFPDIGLRDLEHGVLLHDIGKIGIPDAILLKPGPLTPAEWKIMRTHPEIGRQLVEQVPFLRGAVPIVYHHHERWDGTGYPLGLKGENIPLGARIFAVADAFDAMTFDRPYSRAIPLEDARREIQRSAGTHFDPRVVETFLGLPLEVFETIRRQSVE